MCRRMRLTWGLCKHVAMTVERTKRKKRRSRPRGGVDLRSADEPPQCPDVADSESACEAPDREYEEQWLEECLKLVALLHALKIKKECQELLPDEQRIVARLHDWAKNARLVSDDVFDGTLELRRVVFSHARLTRVIEQRHEEWVAIPGGHTPPLPIYDSLDRLDLDSPQDIEPREWRFLRRGSAATATCDACSRGIVRCTICGGRGGSPCPPFEICNRCYGTRLESGRCERCVGRGIEPCSSCGATGWIACQTCSGTGDLACDICEATGLCTRFIRGMVTREPQADVLADEMPPAVQRAQRRADWTVAPTTEDDELPPCSDEMHARLRTVLVLKPGEVGHQLHLWNLPVCIATFDRDHDARHGTALVVGDSLRVYAPDARSPTIRWAFRALLALVVVVGWVLLLLLLL